MLDMLYFDAQGEHVVRMEMCMKYTLADLIKDRGLNYVSLAKLTGYSRQTISQYIKGKRPMPYEVRSQLAKILKVEDVDVLLAKNRLLLEGGENGTTETREYFEKDLSLQLISIAFKPYSFNKRLEAVSRLMNKFSDIPYEDQKSALLRVISLPFVLGDATMTDAKYGDFLAQCATSVAACWQLNGKSQKRDDILAAYNGASAFLPSLVRIAQDSAEHRSEALKLAAQCALLKSFLAWHIKGVQEALQGSSNAVQLSNDAGDPVLAACALDTQAWAYHHAAMYKKALAAIEQVTPYLNNADIPPVVRSGLQSTLAIMRAKQGVKATDTYKAAIGAIGTETSDPGSYYTYAEILLNGVILYNTQEEYTSSLQTAEQLLNDDLTPKVLMTERARIHTLNCMTLATLRGKRRDRDKAIYYWKAAIQGARSIKSEQRFNEALVMYEIMNTIWNRDKEIKELRDFTQHW